MTCNLSKEINNSLNSIKEYKKFIGTSLIIFSLLLISLLLIKPFLFSNIIQQFEGFFLIIFSAFSNKIYKVKKIADPDKLKSYKKYYLGWLKIEIIVNNLWIIGLIIFIISISLKKMHAQ